MVDFKKLVRSFSYAWRGLGYALSEQNFKIMLVAGLIVVLLMIFLPVTAKESVVLILAITFVLVLELMNTIFERLTELAMPRLHHYVAIIKDVMAAAVFLATLGAIVVGALILWPYLF